jgi:CheY-like chemotaxis protein
MCRNLGQSATAAAKELPSFLDADGCSDCFDRVRQRNSNQLCACRSRTIQWGQSLAFDTEVCNVARDSLRDPLLVLVVDREQGTLEEISKVLKGAGFDCCCCATAQEAAAAASASPPDLIICDWSLHGEGGVETCQQIKRQPGLAHVPVMFLSGAQRPDVIRRAHIADRGAYCLRKPFAPKVLVELVDQALTVPASAAGG